MKKYLVGLNQRSIQKMRKVIFPLKGASSRLWRRRNSRLGSLCSWLEEDRIKIIYIENHSGWVLSVLDTAGLTDNPPVGVLPLGGSRLVSCDLVIVLSFPGTGNDLSRSLGWGGGYMDEPLEEWLTSIQVKLNPSFFTF